VDLEAVGAFLSGVGAVLGAGIGIRLLIKRLDRQCDLRLDAFREGLNRGETADSHHGSVAGPGQRGGVPDGAGDQSERRPDQDRDD